jgi:glycosyltransferase involved in cell wall biosynthesis
MLSYMCAGRPILAAMRGSNAASQVVLREGLGVVVDDGDPTEMAVALRKMLDDPEETAAMGRRARKVAERDFAIDAIADQFEELLDLAPSATRLG